MPITPADLETLLDRYWSVLVAWIGGERQEAEDCVQAAFIRLAAEDPPPTHCVSWLFTVTKRLMINERVAQSRRKVRESRVAAQSDDRHRSNKDTEDIDMRDSLDQLGIREREVVIARIWGNLSFEEIATLVGDSKATVWREYQSGLKRLRELYQEDQR